MFISVPGCVRMCVSVRVCAYRCVRAGCGCVGWVVAHIGKWRQDKNKKKKESTDVEERTKIRFNPKCKAGKKQKKNICLSEFNKLI